MMKETLKVMSNIDYTMLNNQKMTLLNLVDLMPENDLQAKDLDGLINMIDSIHDAIVKDGFRTEAEVEFVNYYRCPKCDNAWEDVWTSTCDDDCPACHTRHISPYKSEEVK